MLAGLLHEPALDVEPLLLALGIRSSLVLPFTRKWPLAWTFSKFALFFSSVLCIFLSIWQSTAERWVVVSCFHATCPSISASLSTEVKQIVQLQLASLMEFQNMTGSAIYFAVPLSALKS